MLPKVQTHTLNARPLPSAPLPRRRPRRLGHICTSYRAIGQSTLLEFGAPNAMTLGDSAIYFTNGSTNDGDCSTSTSRVLLRVLSSISIGYGYMYSTAKYVTYITTRKYTAYDALPALSSRSSLSILGVLSCSRKSSAAERNSGDAIVNDCSEV
ncbi:hypothetical protein BDN70DRAFT_586800 [Pholiota conissans]|uniref:Uncharacterized protein n=1 Tax=Pholiota conissans TaxID=109636 RepID=A0A9P6CSP2_9AGAR|nr:hypothetical protein BDN70DRAFT_586800 [Pholiota conissans]